MVERLWMSVRVLLGFGVTLVLFGVVFWEALPVVGVLLLALGVFCFIAAAVRQRHKPPPPHSIHEELQEGYEARMIVGVVVTAATWIAGIVALFLTGHHALGAVLLAMLIVGPLLAYHVATSATRTHRRRRARLGRQ